MKILILGATGMLGHQLVRSLQQNHEVAGLVRSRTLTEQHPQLYSRIRLYEGFDAEHGESVLPALRGFKPDAVLNCVGIVKQRPEAQDPETSIAVNALLPHQLCRLTRDQGARLIHFSTDCVFTGDKGQPYAESDIPDARDLYGQTKQLGEVTQEGALTLRSSIIGRELRGGLSLVEWALSQRGKSIRGYQHALFTGLTTLEMARLVEHVLLHRPALSGLYQVASAPIDKYHLLELLNEAYGLGLTITPDTEFRCDRRLDGSRFTRESGFAIRSWPEMISQLATAEQPEYTTY